LIKVKITPQKLDGCRIGLPYGVKYNGVKWCKKHRPLYAIARYNVALCSASPYKTYFEQLGGD